MAAYAALVSLMNDLELIPNHPIHRFSFDTKQITSLSQTVNFLIDFMETHNSHGCSAQLMESQIASAAHAAHDVIESHVVDQIHAGTTILGKTRSFFLLDLQKAIDNIDFVKRKAARLKAKGGSAAELLPSASAPLTSEKNVMVGFDAFVSQLMEMVIGGSSRQRVIPIVGMGGMGKTTLAKNVYDSSFIKQRFDIRLWATISQEFSVENILTQLLSREGTSRCENVCELGEELHKMLWGRRYFIVLDDMWSEGAWDKIRMFLPDDGDGSRVIVTTRLSNLAAHLSSSPFEMSFLDEDKSWELFCGNTFGEEDCPVELEEIGRKIVKRCRGLPLSIVVIGGHLRRSSREIEYWKKVVNFMNPISSLGVDDQCLKIVGLSYDYLPACLKPCFLYMGIFQEDKQFDVSELVKLWVGEGFVKAKEGISLEEVAEDHLKDLIDRNLILVRRRRWNGKAANCAIHDIVRELCLKVGSKEQFIHVLENTKTLSKKRRIVIPEGKHNSVMIRDALKSAAMLRSLLRQGWHGLDEMCVGLRRLLRVSSYGRIMYCTDDSMGFQVAQFQQVNLRYLSFNLFAGGLTYFIPSSISLVWNLQTLRIASHGVDFVAPYEIWDMPQIRHLQFRGFYLPDPIPDQQEGIVLRNLHTLEVENIRLTEEVCKRIPNIKELTLRYNTGDCKASSYYCPHNLGRFNKLESLTCEFGADSKWRDVVLSFTFPSSLEELSLQKCPLYWEDLRMLFKLLPRLGSLQLDSVRGHEWDLVDEEFTRLKRLRISRCDDLIHWNANSSCFHFPVLEHLYIESMPKCRESLFDHIGEIPTLRYIKVSYCSVFAAIAAARMLVEQESLGNLDLQLQVSFYRMEQSKRFEKMVEEEGLTSNNIFVNNHLIMI